MCSKAKPVVGNGSVWRCATAEPKMPGKKWDRPDEEGFRLQRKAGRKKGKGKGKGGATHKKGADEAEGSSSFKEEICKHRAQEEILVQCLGSPTLADQHGPLKAKLDYMRKNPPVDKAKDDEGVLMGEVQRCRDRIRQMEASMSEHKLVFESHKRTMEKCELDLKDKEETLRKEKVSLEEQVTKVTTKRAQKGGRVAGFDDEVFCTPGENIEALEEKFRRAKRAAHEFWEASQASQKTSTMDIAEGDDEADARAEEEYLGEEPIFETPVKVRKRGA